MIQPNPFAVPRSLRSPSRPPPPAPPSQPVDLGPVVPVSALTSRGERFRCEPLRATMTARACLLKQSVARGEAVNGKAPIDRMDHHKRRLDNEYCGTCKLGERVAGGVRRGDVAAAVRRAEGR